MENLRLPAIYMSITIIILLIAIIPSTNLAYACSCLKNPTTVESLQNSDAVFIGKVIKVVESPIVFGGERSLYSNTFETESILKGTLDQTVLVETKPFTSSCGYLFMENISYLVFAQETEENILEVKICSGTKPVSEADNDFIKLRNLGIYKSDIQSPLKQVKDGVDPDKIKCKEGLYLAFKKSDKSPSCLEFSTGNKLGERGWITTEFLNVEISTDKNEYREGESIEITIKNLGIGRLTQSGSVLGFLITDETGEPLFATSGGMYGTIANFDPGDEFSYTWNQTKDKNLVNPGKYILKTEFRHFLIPYETTHMITILNEDG